MGASELKFHIRGMTCAACVSRLETVLGSIPGAEGVTVNLATGRARVLLPGEVEGARDLVRKAVADSGYEAVFSGAPDPELEAKREFGAWIRAAVLSIPLVLMLPLPFWVQALIASLIQFGSGAKFYAGAWKSIRSGSANMDVLVVLGTSAAYGLSFFSHHPWFESSAMILVLVRLGKWLELRARIRTTRALRALEILQPTTARVCFGDQTFEVPISGVRRGDRILVLPGERVPSDGRVYEGESDLDESFLTGESRLLQRSPGDGVRGGALNVTGPLRIEVTAIGSETLLSRIIALIESAQDKKPPIQRVVDRVSSVFVPVVLLIAIGVFFWISLSSGFGEAAVIRAVTVLVIACPCALGLATPTALMVGTGLAAKHGIFIRDMDALELANRITVLALDKTGTLTTGKPVLTRVEAVGSKEDTLRIARALQSGSEHPLARAILQEAPPAGPALKATGIRVLPGRGIEGRVDGALYRMGSERLLESSGIRTPESAGTGSCSYLIEAGDSPRLLATFWFEDGLKPGAAPFVRRLKSLGIRPVLLTGDREEEALRVAGILGIETVHASMLPEEKAAWIESLRHGGECVAMLGDGINDAPALALADVGLALSTGTDAAMQTAGITLLGGDPLKSLEAIRISKATYRRIRLNLAWAFVYNLIGIPLAVTGSLSPVHAGAAMALSSVSVVLSSLLLGKSEPETLENPPC
jgi:Cu+-exporting ATPase